MRPRVREDGRVMTGTPAYSTSLPVVPVTAIVRFKFQDNDERDKHTATITTNDADGATYGMLRWCFACIVVEIIKK